jgi:hypothetical protein
MEMTIDQQTNLLTGCIGTIGLPYVIMLEVRPRMYVSVHITIHCCNFRLLS